MINNIQALRAFAAISVVLYHTLDLAKSYGYRTQSFMFMEGWGGNGVDIFFVISGFVMVYIQYSKPKKPTEFMMSRIKRIVPLYWSITLLVVLLMYFIPTAFGVATFNVKHSILSFLFLNHYFSSAFPVIIPGWTLEYEMFFYFLFGLSLFFSRSKNAVLVSLFLIVYVILFNKDIIVIEFVMGMLVAYLYIKQYFINYGNLLFYAGLAGILMSIIYRPDINRVIFQGLPSMLLVLGSCYLPQTKSRILLFLGSASYSIYLIHTLTMPVFYKLMRMVGFPVVFSDLLVLMCLLYSVLLGGVMYSYYEKPINKYLR
jgi:exopolysaccharide production protein ExoZ